MRGERGFTLLELMTAFVILGVLAALAIPVVRSARRNANVTSATFELALWLDGLRTRALRDQQDLLAVVVDVPGNNAEPCAHGVDAMCGRYYLLRPQAGFRLDEFDPDAPLLRNASHVEREQLPPPVRFHRGADGLAAPRPFGGISAFDPELVAACGARACVAIRFRGDGTVDAELPTGEPPPLKGGIAFALGSDVAGAGSDQRGILVSFPTGIVRSYPLAP